MKKIVLLMFLFLVSLNAEVINQILTKELLDKNIPIVDIRTPGEWKQTGLVKGSIPIMFFDERGKYDIPKFLKELNQKVDTTKPFALICRTGSRTILVSDFLSKQLGYKVINIKGGITLAVQNHIPIEPYKK